MIERERTNRHGRRRERDECICVLKQTFDQSADCCQSYVATAYPSVPVARPRIQFCVFTRRGNQRSRSFVAPVRVHSRRNLAKNTYTSCTYNISPLRRSMCKVVVPLGRPCWCSLFRLGGRRCRVRVARNRANQFSLLTATNVGDDDGRKRW